jgi:hypothetical protein
MKTVRTVAGDLLALFMGAVTAKVAVNMTTEGGSEHELWSWPNIGVSLLSGMVLSGGAYAMGAKPRVALRIFEGACLISLYKAFTTKLAPKWQWTNTWFGEDDDEIHPDLLGASYYPQSGAMYQGADNTYVYGQDGQLRPIDDSHRDPMVMGYNADLVAPSPSFSADLVVPSPSLSGALVDPNPTLADDDPAVSTIRAYRRSYNRLTG